MLWVEQLEAWALAAAAAGAGNPAKLIPAVRDAFDAWLESPVVPPVQGGDSDLDRLHQWLGVA